MKLNPLFGKILTYYIYSVGLLSLCFYLFAKPAIILFTHHNFYESYKIIGLLATANFISGIFYLLLPPLYFAKDVKYMTIIQIIAVLGFVILTLFVLPYLGITGAAIALVAASFFMILMLYL